MFRSLLLAVVLALSATAAGADAYVPLAQRLTPGQLQETGLDTLTPAQLARLDELLRGEAAAAADARQAAVVAARAEAAAAAPPVDPNRFAGMAEGPIRARIQGSIAGWTEGDEVRLDNGQVWKVLKGHFELPRALDSPEILVVPGVAGRWFLQVDEDLPKARVYRVD